MAPGVKMRPREPAGAKGLSNDKEQMQLGAAAASSQGREG